MLKISTIFTKLVQHQFSFDAQLVQNYFYNQKFTKLSIRQYKLGAALVMVCLLAACGEYGSSSNETQLGAGFEEQPVVINEIVIYSPAPSKIMLHAHNLALGDKLKACGVAENIRVVPMPLPDSINFINRLDASEKPYHLPIVTTLDFKTAIEASAPAWHGYRTKNPDLRFVASLYDVAFGLLAVDSSIQAPTDLVGKRIAVPARPSAVRWFTETLLADGWGLLDQVTLVDFAPPNVPAAVARGEIDVVAWNIMSETPDGYLPLLPMLLKGQGEHWLDVDLGTVNAINAASPFATEQTTVELDSIVGAGGKSADREKSAGGEESGKSVNLLSFRQALAAWASTPGELITDIVNCMSQADMPFGSDAAFADRQFDWPSLTKADIHFAATAVNAHNKPLK